MARWGAAAAGARVLGARAEDNSCFEARGLDCIRGERPVFRDVSFTLRPGGALVLRGPNGAGKSSLLRILAGLLKPVGGSVGWGDGTIAEEPEEHRRRIHYVGHLEAVKPSLTAAENLTVWAGMRGFDAAAADALERFDLSSLAETPGRFLSAGQRRRLALARLIATHARLWLLDEPTVTLDAASTARLEAVIAEHRSGGGMVIVATHTDIGLGDADLRDMGAHQVSMATMLADAGVTAGEGPVEYDAW
jgi:heme exporter protein A